MNAPAPGEEATTAAGSVGDTNDTPMKAEAQSTPPDSNTKHGTADDPVEAASTRLVDDLNTLYASTLLLIAWTKRKDTILAQLISVDRLGLWIRCHFHGNVYSEERVNFPGGVKDTLKKVARTVVTTMHDEASIWRWPSGPLPFIVLLVYAAILLVWFESHGKGELTVFPHDWAEHLPTREMLGYGILAVIGMHALEGVACCYVLHKRHRFPKKSLPSWFLACMFLGYPVACQVLCIKRADREGKLKHL